MAAVGYRLVWAAGLVGLHVGIWVTMGLDYFAWIACVVALCAPWAAILRSPTYIPTSAATP